jgi:hypothetical protein
MSTILNLLYCSTGYGNTGVPDCFVDLKKIKHLILTPANFKLTEAQLASEALTKAALQAATIASPETRIFPIGPFVDIADNSEETQFETTGYGDRFPIRDGDYNWKLFYKMGGLCLMQQLRKLNGRNWKAYIVDDNDQMFGQMIGAELHPIDINYYAEKLMTPTGDQTTRYAIDINVPDPTQFVDKFGFVKFTFPFASQIKGILNVQLQVESAGVTALKVKAFLGCSKTDLFDTYADELADTDLWIIPGVTITGVTLDVPNKNWVIAATLSGTKTVSLAAPAVLAAEGVGAPPDNGLESDIVSFDAGS